MASSYGATTEAQMKSEIERLTATINQHKMHNTNKNLNQGGYSTNYSVNQTARRSNVYVNPNYKPTNKYIRPGLNTAASSETAIATDPSGAGPSSTSSTSSEPTSGTVTPAQSSGVSTQKKEIVLGGVAFESSSRSLVRKDLPRSNKPVSIGKPAFTTRHHPYGHKPGHVLPTRAYKVKALWGRNMTLNNSTRPYPRKSSKRLNRYSEKPCPRFTTTGACTRGLTCMYQHDPSKIAICWNFLQDHCPNSAETCNLSHEPIPQRTPLCLHFLNKGRCTREKCPFPHVNVGQRQGVCRDFAVLGYCERGLDCDRQHVRECPDFAEKGACGTKGCKLPHVIRANRNRKVAGISATASAEEMNMEGVTVAGSDSVVLTAEDGQLGDEYISLTFKESDSEDEEESESGTESDEDEEDESVMSVNM